MVISLDPVYGFFTVFSMLMVEKQSNTKKVESQSIRRKNNKLNILTFLHQVLYKITEPHSGGENHK